MSDKTGQLFQLNTFETGFIDGTALTIPSTDSSGIAYHPPSGNLFIADSEIAELSIFPEVISQNVFQVSLDGQTLIQSYDLTDETVTGVVNDEPTGISYSLRDNHFYITNDNTFEVYRYDLQSSGEQSILVAVDSVSLEDLPPELPGITGDFEGVSVSPRSGLIYVVDGVGQAVVVLNYTEQFELVDSFLLNSEEQTIVRDPEGIAVNPETDNLFVISEVDNLVAEYTNEGEWLATYSLDNLSPSQIAAQGLTFGPASGKEPTLGAEDLSSLYIADGRIDNNEDPEERDGRIYETRPLIVPLFGTLSGEELTVIGSKEIIFAGAGKDLIEASGSQGNNRIYGGSGDDDFFLGSNDRLFGNEGNDRFFALSGAENTITGGEGADQFWVATAEFPESANIITDFTSGEDVIGIAGLGIGFEDLSLTTINDDTLIVTDTQELALLSGIEAENLNADNFVFV